MASLEDLTANELLAHAKRLEEGNRLYGPLMNDPETRGEMLRLIKKKNPGMPIPEIDAQDAASRLVASERAEREKLQSELRDEKLHRQLRESRERVKNEYDFTDADLLEVEKLMTDEKAPIPHWDAAAKVYRASRAQATPTAQALEAPVYEMPSKDKWGHGIGRPAELNKIAMKEAVAAFNDISSGRVKLTS